MHSKIVNTQEDYNRNKANALSKESTRWHKFFTSNFDNAQDCIAAMPKHTEATISIVNYYLALHPNKTNINRQWINISAAHDMGRTTKAWKKFFTSEFTTFKDCLQAMPAHTQKTSTIIMYYLASHPDIAQAYNRAWEYQAMAHDLYKSDALWERFFETKFTTPLSCIKAMPAHTQSTTTIMVYYLGYHPELFSERIWANAASATALSNASKDWQLFFDTQFKSPQDCLGNTPSHTQAAGTIINYYTSVHPEISNARRWTEYARAKDLITQNKSWRLFFTTNYRNPKDCILAIPHCNTISIVSIMNYYIAYHTNLEKPGQWRDFACGLVFFKKNTALFNSLSAEELSAKETQQKHKNNMVSIKSLRAYWQMMRVYGCDLMFIQSINTKGRDY